MSKANQPVSEANLLNGRYQLGPQIGAGAQAVTYRATDVQTGCEVAIKILRLADVSDWKGLELFERETATLRNLDHPGIPSYVDDFVVEGEGGARTYHLVQEFVDGQPLQDLAPLDEAHFARILEDLLDILEYLSTHSPSVVHRDIKPDNVLIDREHGRAHLVDFGCVQVIMPRDTGGSTVVGTTGFMAPEQLMGMSDPRSDLYGLGATCIFAITGESPANLEQKRMKIIWRDRAKGFDEMTLGVIDRFVEPHAEDRYQSVTDARRALAGGPSEPVTELVISRPDDMLEYRRSTEPPNARASIWSSNTFVLRVPGYLARGELLASVSGAAFTLVVLAFAIHHGSAFGVLVVIGLASLAVLALFQTIKARYEEGTLRIEDGRFSVQYKQLVGVPITLTGDQNKLLGLRPGRSKQDDLYVETSDGLMPLARSVDRAEREWLCGEVSHELQRRF